MTKWISRASVLRIIDADPVYSDVINEKTYMASQINNLPTKEETSRPHGKWGKRTIGYLSTHDCSVCGFNGNQLWHFCPNCGASMQTNDRQVTGKLGEEAKDSHAEYWNSIGEWKEGDEK